MESMFNNCSSLEKIDLTGFSTNSVNKMDYMFYSCTKLISLNIVSFNTEQCFSFNNIFENCYGLELYLNPITCNNLFEYIPSYVIIHNITKEL